MAGGAPFGNKNNTKNRPWADAIRKALVQYQNDQTKGKRALDVIAYKVVDAAVNNLDWDAIHEIANRMDGKPRQQMELSGDDGEAIKIEFITDAADKARRKLAKMLSKAIIDGGDK